ncbi:EpsG family protein [Shewanella basaltis]|uniref:EpsG family protein n=1 Tax=Shewanella basaltis TaxID=472183 RepID=UPI00200E020F|nr:EpsG family protein [Shewanella basaltis]MCL1112987.1 EpsG family protein [Shewanella basaltis]
MPLYYKVFSFFFALLYAYFLTNLPLLDLVDRENYLSYTELSSVHLIGYLNSGFIKLLTNEPLWLTLNIVLGLFLEPENVLRTIIFFPAFIVSYLVIVKEPKIFLWAVFILFFPLVIKNHIIHLRQGVAIAVFVIGYLGGYRSTIKNILIISTIFIHSSFYFVVLFYYTVIFINNIKISLDLKLSLVVLFCVAIGLSIGVLVEFTGARQVQRIENASGGSSGLSFVFWLLIFISIIIQKKSYIRSNLFSLSQIILYLSTYFTFPYTARIFESSMIVILLSVVDVKSYKKFIPISMLVLLCFYLWAGRFQLPYYGFGV